MRAPKCRLCGNEHYGLCPVFGSDRIVHGVAVEPAIGKRVGRSVETDTGGKEIAKPKGDTPRSAKRADDHAVSKGTATPVMAQGTAAKFDKVAYQRNYMRDRRAKQKAQRAP